MRAENAGSIPQILTKSLNVVFLGIIIWGTVILSPHLGEISNLTGLDVYLHWSPSGAYLGYTLEERCTLDVMITGMVCVGLCWVRDAVPLPPAHHVGPTTLGPTTLGPTMLGPTTLGHTMMGPTTHRRIAWRGTHWPHTRSLPARRTHSSYARPPHAQLICPPAARTAHTSGLSRLFHRQVHVLQAAHHGGRRWHGQRAMMSAVSPAKTGALVVRALLLSLGHRASRSVAWLCEV